MSNIEKALDPPPDQPLDADPTDSRISQLLLDSGRLTGNDLRRIMNAQSQHALRFADAALSLGLVNEADLDFARLQRLDCPHLRPGESRLSVELVAAYQPFAVQAEALRALRVQLMRRWFHERGKTLAVVSARDNEGRSTLAANLAIVFAQFGERTLLIDANVRQSSQHRLFGLPQDTGLSSLLDGHGSFKEAPTKIEPFDNLFVLPAGPTPDDPQELLGRASFAKVIEVAPFAFDVVIVDTPPVLDYADTQTIAARAGACLLVTRRHRTRLTDVQKTKAKLQSTGAVLLGAVLTE